MNWQIVGVFQRFLCLVFLYTGLRFIFFAQNYSLFKDLGVEKVFEAFAHGIRFDISGILIANLFIFMAWLLPKRIQDIDLFQKMMTFLFIGWNYVLFSANTADAELFNFNGKRLTLDYFRMAKDIEGQAIQLIGYYWHLASAAVVFAIILYKFSFRWKGDRKEFRGSITFKTLSVFGILVLTVLGVRGGLQLKPLRPTHAYVYQESDMGALVLNSTFSMLRGKSSELVKPQSFFASNEEVIEKLYKNTTPLLKWKHKKPQNVVILMLESFSLEYMGVANSYKGYTPFLDQLSKRSLFFRNNFANGRRSIEAIPSILASVPSLMPEPFISSSYQTNKVIGLGNLLKGRGYHTSFFHGAENGSMFFDSFTRRLGFEHYFGLNEYPDSNKDFDGNWGIYDGPFLQFALKKMNGFPKPFVSGIFTLSSHQPYSIPKELEGQFPKGTLEIHESIGYADHALKEFFAQAEKQPWYKDTLFVITGDHTQKSDQEKYRTLGGKFRVPLLFFYPQQDLSPHGSDRITQHTDILPSVIDWLNLEMEERNFFGRSVFRSQAPGWAFNYIAGDIWLFSPSYVVTLKPDNQLLGWSHQKTYELSPVEVPNDLRQEVKALKQYYLNGLIGNSWYYQPGKN